VSTQGSTSNMDRCTALHGQSMQEGNIMKFRKYAVAAAIATMMVGTSVAVMGGGSANASGTTIETITESKTMVNANCYVTNERAVTYYHHSTTYGWERYPSPKVVTTHSETCDK